MVHPHNRHLHHNQPPTSLLNLSTHSALQHHHICCTCAPVHQILHLCTLHSAPALCTLHSALCTFTFTFTCSAAPLRHLHNPTTSSATHNSAPQHLHDNSYLHLCTTCTHSAHGTCTITSAEPQHLLSTSALSYICISAPAQITSADPHQHRLLLSTSAPPYRHTCTCTCNSAPLHSHLL